MEIEKDEKGWVRISGPERTPLEKFEIAFFRKYGFFPDDGVLQNISNEDGKLIISWYEFSGAV
jgi:hypothetical protein